MVLNFVALLIMFDWMNKQLVCQTDIFVNIFLSDCIILEYFM